MEKKETEKNIINVVCEIQKIRYFQNDFIICVASVDSVKEGAPIVNRYGEFVFKGESPELIVGQKYNLKAEYVNDDKWGEQYNILCIYSNVDKVNPDGRKSYLSSLFTEKQIKAMYTALDDPYAALENENIELLIKIKGVEIKTAVAWCERFHRYTKDYEQIYIELEDYNLTHSMVNKLLESYKSPLLVIDKVKNNPYVLCNEVKGIGWKSADKIALKSGIGEFDVRRISACMLNYLKDVGENGCSWITPDELLGATLDFLGEEVPDEKITESIRLMIKNGVLWTDEKKERLGLMKYYKIENKIAKELIRIRDAKSKVEVNSNWMDGIHRIEQQNGWNFTDEQINGVETVLNNNVTVVYGLAGTGKSSVVSGMIESLRQYSYVQCALSGRASARMAEITGETGFTIHRLLGYPDSSEEAKNKFTFHDENPLPYDIYLLDEISMVDASLFYNLLRAIPSGAKIVCLGDVGQLPCIGMGNVGLDMIMSPDIPSVHLTKIHRQAADSGIITESLRMRKGEQIIEKDWTGNCVKGKNKDFLLECYSDKNQTYYSIINCFKEIMKEPNFDIMKTQVIVPIKSHGNACTYKLNIALQELYNPSSNGKEEIVISSKFGDTVFRTGDKVLNTKNCYRIKPNIFNGNIGTIESIDEFTGRMIVNFIGIGAVELETEQIKALELGYAVTVHKMQGSEFDTVICGIDFNSYSLLSRELLYTAITRAKKRCFLKAQNNALRFAVSREIVNKKQTHLQECLDDIVHPKLKKGQW